MQWGHPDQQPFATQQAGTQVTLTAEPGGENMSKQNASKAAATAAKQAGQFARVWDGNHSVDATVAKGARFKQPGAAVFVRAFADYDAAIAATLGVQPAAPAAAAAESQQTATEAAPDFTAQLALALGKAPETAAKAAAPPAPVEEKATGAVQAPTANVPASSSASSNLLLAGIGLAGAAFALGGVGAEGPSGPFIRIADKVVDEALRFEAARGVRVSVNPTTGVRVGEAAAEEVLEDAAVESTGTLQAVGTAIVGAATRLTTFIGIIPSYWADSVLRPRTDKRL